MTFKCHFLVHCSVTPSLLLWKKNKQQHWRSSWNTLKHSAQLNVTATDDNSWVNFSRSLDHVVNRRDFTLDNVLLQKHLLQRKIEKIKTKENDPALSCFYQAGGAKLTALLPLGAGSLLATVTLLTGQTKQILVLNEFRLGQKNKTD